jgi:hypothetical protein
MHLQLVGRLDPNETYAIFNIENVTNILSGNWINLELLNIIICQDQDHSHFEVAERAPYPTDPNRYQEKILVSIPKPRQVTFRRRTFQLTEQVVPPLGESTTALVTPPVKRFRRSVPLEPLQMEFLAIFKSNIHRFEIADFPNSSIARVIEKLQNEQRPRIINHFQKLFTSWPSYELISDPSTRRGSKRVKITLPPMTRLMCTSQEIYKLMGLEQHISPLNVQGTNYFALLNTSRTEEKIFIGELSADTAMKFSVQYESELCPQLLRWHFMRYPDTFPATIVTFAEAALCRQNPRAAEMFLRLTLECVEDYMALPFNCLTATLMDGNFVQMTKAPEFYNPSDNSNNFSILIRLGEKLQELLGFEDNIIAWTLGKKEQKYHLKLTDPPESAEESSHCMTVISDILPQHFNNQHGPNPLIAERQEKWQKYLRDQEEQRLQQLEQALEHERAKEEQQSGDTQQEEEEQRIEQEIERVQEEEREQETHHQEELEQQTSQLERQLLLKKKDLKRLIDDEEAAQEYLHTFETAEAERVFQERTSELELVNQETIELDTVEQRASAAARAGNEEEAQQLVQQWKDLKIDIDERRKLRKTVEEDRLEAYRMRLERLKDTVRNLIESRQQIEDELHTLKTSSETAEEEEESERGRQQLLRELEAEEARLEAEGDGSDDAAAVDGDDDEQFIQVEINNPFPRPPTSFMVANAAKKHICTAPEKFPDHCTILLKEGEPDDYVTSRGLCCVLGIIRKSTPNIQSNTKCIIKRFQTLKYISLEFVDESLNTFKIASSVQPMWIKIDLSCNKYF